MNCVQPTRAKLVLTTLTVVFLGACDSERPPSPNRGDEDGDVDVVTDRGASAGARRDIDDLRDAFDETDPIEEDNPNELAAAPGSERREPMDVLRQERVAPVNLVVSGTLSTGRLPWSSFSGGLLSAELVATDYTSNWPLPDRQVCIAPVPRIDCCSYNLTEGVDGSGTSIQYYSTLDLYADDASATVALREIYAQVPMYLPYTNGKVKLGGGWIYNDDDRTPHGSCDYSKTTAFGEDPSFRVRAIASGHVVSKFWDPWHGNVLIIEHEDAGDIEYRSFYFHLRNATSNAVNMAKTRTSTSGAAGSATDRYLKFANREPINELWWGTEGQAIPVDVGDYVWAQRHIAWSGNTGPGGAAAGLEADGAPESAITANNHLHFMVAVRHPTWTGGEWVYVDFYGVYEQQESGCYDLLDNTQFDRLAAPFYPYFHGVDLGVFNYYLYYYGQMGLLPTTLSIQRPSGGAIAAGTFKNAGAGWSILDYLMLDDFETHSATQTGNGLWPVAHSVTLDSSNVPRHNALFRVDATGDWHSFDDLTVAEFQSQFDTLTAAGYDLIDFFGYRDGTTDRIAAIFAPEPGDFLHHGMLTAQQFKDLSDSYANDGWMPVDVNVMELSGGTYFSGLYRQTGDARMVHWGMSPVQYQQWMDFYLSQGWDLQVVQSYAHGQRYAAIWSI